MGIDLLRIMLIQAHKPVQNIVTCGSIIGSTCLPVRRTILGRIRNKWASGKPGVRTFIIRKVILHWAHRQLLLEAIDLVEEQDDTRLCEPSRVANAVEKGKGLLHTVDGLVLEKKLIVFGDGDQEKNRGDVLEAVNPLLSFRSLTTNIVHAIGEFANVKGGLSDASGLDSGAKNILIVGNVVGVCDARDGIEVAIK